jgi:hypothetical protein
METFQNQNGQKLVVSFDVGIKFLAVCAFTVGEGDCSQIIDWNLLPLAAEKEKIPSINVLSFRLYEKLDELWSRLEVAGYKYIDRVLIENQPSRLNGAMKSIQMLIYGYYQMRKYLEGQVDEVLLYAPHNKLKEHTKIIDVPDVVGKKNKRAHYIVNKKKSVAFMRQYIQNCPLLMTMMDGNKKQDDLSDALIQGLAWVRKQGYMIEHCFAFNGVAGSVLGEAME